MKSFITLVLVLSSAHAFAYNCDTKETSEVIDEQREISTNVPSHLKGATICVKLSDGKESCVPAERFKVVPRKQQYLVAKTHDTRSVTCTTTVEAEEYKNRLTLLGGVGPSNGVNVTRDGNTVTMENRSRPVIGGEYQRDITRRFHLGVQGISNQTGLVGAGLNF